MTNLFSNCCRKSDLDRRKIFNVKGKLGEGRYGTVFAGIEIATGNTYAVKSPNNPSFFYYENSSWLVTNPDIFVHHQGGWFIILFFV